MAGSLDFEQLAPGRNQLQRFSHLVDRAERIARSVNEQAWRVQVGQVLGPVLLGLARRMQRIRKQQQPRYEFRFCRAQQRGLAATERNPTEKNSPGGRFANDRNCIPQARAIALGIARERRAMPPLLPERQVTAQDGLAGSGERFAHRNQQRRVAVAPCSVSENQGITVRIGGRMQETANGRVEGIVEKCRGLKQ